MNSKVEKVFVPIEFYGRAHYDNSGQLQSVDVCVNGRESILTHREPNESIGDLFERAYEAGKTLQLTQRWSEPIHEADDPETAGSR